MGPATRTKFLLNWSPERKVTGPAGDKEKKKGKSINKANIVKEKVRKGNLWNTRQRNDRETKKYSIEKRLEKKFE